MGRPLNNRHFGDDDNRIAITYKVEGTEYIGYIVKQLSTSEYRVTIDGVETHDVYLAQTEDEKNDLKDGFGFVVATDLEGNEVQIVTIWSRTLKTVDGEVVQWATEGDNVFIIQQIKDVTIGENSGTVELEPELELEPEPEDTEEEEEVIEPEEEVTDIDEE